MSFFANDAGDFLRASVQGEIVDDHVGTLVRKDLGNASPNALPRSSYDGNFSLQLHLVSFASFSEIVDCISPKLRGA
jgi:hypothetical protein